MLSKKVMITRNTILRGNLAIYSTKVTVTTSSTLSSIFSGCKKHDGMKGSSGFFISHSFECGQTGGSHGGRGGIGLGLSKNLNETLNCVKNSISRMSSYGNPTFPVASGSTGSPLNFKTETSIPAAGSILIIAFSLSISKSSAIVAGYGKETENFGIAGSGGGIKIISYSMKLKGLIKANGQASKKFTHGAGGGGRIFLHDICWFVSKEGWENESILKKMYFTIPENHIEAKSGIRPEIEVEDLKKFKKLVRAQDGCKFNFF